MADDAPVRRIATKEAFAIPEQFERYLRIVLGHLGEGLPYFVYRMDYMSRLLRQIGSHEPYELDPSEYLRRNFLITTSGMNHDAPAAAAS